MNRITRAAAWILVLALAAFMPLWAASLGKRIDRGRLVMRDYDTWTGVLRLWKCEGWQSGNGTMTAWLNACVEKFEKRHKGVYIQITDVSEETMRSFASGSVNPPDMLVYAPGMLEAPYDLLQLKDSLPVRENVSALGLWNAERYAAPIALGGYALAVNRSAATGNTAGTKNSQKKKTVFAFDTAADGKYVSWSAALLALFAGGARQEDGQTPPAAEDGIDLGLEAVIRSVFFASDAQGSLIADGLPEMLPDDFRTRESVYSRFTSGEIAAMPVTQREIRRLQLLDESGKAPDWYAESIGMPFTDQAMLFSITARQRSDAAQRQQLCCEFMNLLLSAEMQSKLTQVRAFSVLDLSGMYAGNRSMNSIEKMLLSEELVIPPAFGSEWRRSARSLAEEAAAGKDTRQAYDKLREMLIESESSA